MSHDEKLAIATPDTSEQSVARLLKLSGERADPTEEATARAHAAALEVWQTSVKQERLRSHLHVFWRVAAAVVVVAIGAFLWTSSRIAAPGASVVARSVIVSSGTQLIDSSGAKTALNAGTTINAKSEVETYEGGASFNVGDSLSLRVKGRTRLRFDAENRVTLLAGVIYVDSGGLSAHSELGIVTPAGEVRHEGTQYQVSVAGGVTRIQVREGRVRLGSGDSDQATHIIAGEGVDVDLNGNVARRAISSFGADWEWASALATPLDIENRPLVEFLAWIARENGWQLRYTSPEQEREVQSIRLHGIAKGKTPEETLQRIALLTGVPMHVEDGMLVIGMGGA